MSLFDRSRQLVTHIFFFFSVETELRKRIAEIWKGPISPNNLYLNGRIARHVASIKSDQADGESRSVTTLTYMTEKDDLGVPHSAISMIAHLFPTDTIKGLLPCYYFHGNIRVRWALDKIKELFNEPNPKQSKETIQFFIEKAFTDPKRFFLVAIHEKNDIFLTLVDVITPTSAFIYNEIQ